MINVSTLFSRFFCKKTSYLPIEVLSLISNYLKHTDMIEASAVGKHWYDAAHSNIKYCSRFQEMKYIFLDKG